MSGGLNAQLSLAAFEIDAVERDRGA